MLDRHASRGAVVRNARSETRKVLEAIGRNEAEQYGRTQRNLYQSEPY